MMKMLMPTFLLVASSILLLQDYAFATVLHPVGHQQVSCSNDEECNLGFIFPLLECNAGTCEAPEVPPAVGVFARGIIDDRSPGPAGTDCTSARQCQLGLVCISGNPRGTCGVPEGMIGLSQHIVDLIQEDYTPGIENSESRSDRPNPSQPTPLRTSRAMAMIYLAVHDTYGILTGDFDLKITSQVAGGPTSEQFREALGDTSGIIENQIEGTAIIAGLSVASALYPESIERINAVRDALAGDIIPLYAAFAKIVGDAWLEVRSNDGSQGDITDFDFDSDFLDHRPDPNVPIVRPGTTQDNLGRNWGQVRPFVLSDVESEANLEEFPAADSQEYRDNLDEVRVKGQCNSLTQGRFTLEEIGLFWGYDGAPLIGVPPRLYLQVILAVQELKTLSFKEQVRAFAAVGASMADAGIAAWFWKFKFNLWRPVIGIRQDEESDDPKWDPRGVGLTNIVPKGTTTGLPPKCVGINPNFPAYPSGHATFGTSAFSVLSKLLGKQPKDISVTFTSDEFNGVSVEGTTGMKRKEITQTFSLQEGIQQNSDSRVFIGVHWRFDSEGGELVGEQIATIAAKEFSF